MSTRQRLYTLGSMLGALAVALMLGVAGCSPDELVTPTFRYGQPGGNNGGNGKAGGGSNKKGDIYADLLLLYRATDGRPIMAEYGTEACVQPVSYSPIPGISSVTNPVNGADVWLVPLIGGGTTEAEASCDIDPDFLAYAREVDLGRLNLGRSPTKVLDRAFAEVLRAIDDAGTVLLDPAGRLEPDAVVVDAPAENYAIHVQLEMFGQLTGPQGTYPLPTQPGGSHAFLDHAASGLAGAADKTGSIGVDLVAYSNRIMRIPEITTALGVLASQRVGGVLLGVPGESYVSYLGYSYSRSATFPGCASGYLVGTTLTPFSGSLMHLVFGDVDFTGSNINGFAQRADDALKVIAFTHDNVITTVDRIGEGTTCP